MHKKKGTKEPSASVLSRKAGLKFGSKRDEKVAKCVPPK